MLKKFRILLVLILIFCGFMPIINQSIMDYTKLHAKETIEDNYYNTTKSLRWSNPSMIKVYIEDDSNSGKSYMFKRGLALWNSYLNLFTFYYVNDKEKADIVCYFVPKLNATRLGETREEYDKNNIYTKATITIAYSNDSIGKFKDDHSFFFRVILHEIGHALGIAYHSDNPNDIMFPYENEKDNPGVLTSRDVNTMKKIYSNR